MATVPNTFQEREERREETEEGVVPKITFLSARQSLWLIPLSSHMQVTPYGCRRCPVCPLTWSLTAMVTWTVPLCLAFTCSSPWSSCCRWTTDRAFGKQHFMFFLISFLSTIIFSFHRLLSTFLLPSHHLLFFSSSDHLSQSRLSPLPLRFFPFRSWFPSPSTFPLSWWRLVRSFSSLTMLICMTRRRTAASSVRPWTSQRTWDRLSTSSQIRRAPSLRTRWCFADAPSWAPSTRTRRMVILHAVIWAT